MQCVRMICIFSLHYFIVINLKCFSWSTKKHVAKSRKMLQQNRNTRRVFGVEHCIQEDALFSWRENGILWWKFIRSSKWPQVEAICNFPDSCVHRQHNILHGEQMRHDAWLNGPGMELGGTSKKCMAALSTLNSRWIFIFRFIAAYLLAPRTQKLSELTWELWTSKLDVKTERAATLRSWRTSSGSISAMMKLHSMTSANTLQIPERSCCSDTVTI